MKKIITTTIVATMLLSAISAFAETSPSPEAVRQNIQQMKDTARKRIDAVKDEAKRTTANNIVDRINHVNQVWTNHFMRVLDHLSAVIEKIKSRTQKVASSGQDVASVNAAIQKATDAIAVAKAAVEAQAQKEYVVNTTAIAAPANTKASQANLVARLREQFKTLRDQLFQDLTFIRDGVMRDARKAVQDALQALKKIPNIEK